MKDLTVMTREIADVIVNVPSLSENRPAWTKARTNGVYLRYGNPQDINGKLLAMTQELELTQTPMLFGEEEKIAYLNRLELQHHRRKIGKRTDHSYLYKNPV